MPRVLTILIAIAGAALLTLLAVVLLASVTGPRLSSTVEIAGLASPVEIGIDESGVLQVEARQQTDLFAGLGYGHALGHAWSMTLLKVAAAGRLSQHAATPAAVAIDRHVATIGIPSTARRAYRAMPDSVRALFDAYASGVNSSVTRNRLVRSHEFIVSPLVHEPWEPWHPIAVEMLLAYLASSAHPEWGAEGRQAGRPPAVGEFIAADALLRTTLALDGFQHSLAFTVPDTVGTHLFHRLVYGETGMPLVQLAELTLGGRAVAASTIPGTLALPGGYSDDRAWAFVPTMSAVITLSAATPPDPQYGRVVRHDGSEILIASRRSSGRLFIAEGHLDMPASPIDEEDGRELLPEADDNDIDREEELEAPQRGWWTLEWPGIAHRGTDISAWLALLTGGEPVFQVFSGATLIMTAAGDSRVVGSPAFSAAVPGGILIGGSPTAGDVAERLAAAGQAPFTEGIVGTDTYSTWAARLVTPLVEAMGHPDSVAVEVSDPIAFLHGWDHRFEPDVIAASIFDRWMRVYQRNAGSLPDPDTLDLTPVERVDTLQVTFAEIVAEQQAEARREGRRPPAAADTLAAHPERADSLIAVTRSRTEDPHDLRVLKHAFGQAVSELEQIHGLPGPAWRWHRVQDARLRFPGRTDRPGAAPDSRRHQNVPLGDGGHPSTIQWGPSHLVEGTHHPASWAAWLSTARPDRIDFLLREPFREPLDIRYADPPEPTQLRTWTRGTPIQRPIRLVPPS